MPDLARAEELVELATNQFRAEQGLKRAAPDATLERAARGFADFMARTHSADGAPPAERARGAGYDYCLVSENISYQYSSEPFATADLARRYVEGWKDSPGHRKNMLEPGAADMAIAMARSPRSGRYYAVQMFGRPRSKSIEFRVTNAARRAVDYRIAARGYTLRPREARVHTLCTPEDVSFPGAGVPSGAGIEPNGKGRKIRPSGGDNLVVRGEAHLTVGAER
jgi:hypothetical protein